MKGYHTLVDGMLVIKKKEKTKREKIYMKIMSLLMTNGWHWKERYADETRFTKVSRMPHAMENGEEFKLSLIQPCRTCWVTISADMEWANGAKTNKVCFFGRLNNKKDLKHIERLLNIK